MTTTRILPAVLVAVLGIGGSAFGQYRMPPYAQPGSAASVVPPLAPAGAFDPDSQGPLPAPRPSPGATLDRLVAPIPPGAAAGEADPVGTLTSPPGMPAGTYGSPWFTDGPGCGGPTGSHGPISYDVYTQTGPSLPFGSGPFTDRLHVGWNIGGGGRSLFFNQAGDAAWAFDIGLNYTYNRGSNDDFINLFTRQPPLQGSNNQAIPQADVYQTVRIAGLDRTAFTFALGRDWFIWGTGKPGAETDWNLRVGTDVGGRWGTAHVDLQPLAGGYSRRQAVFKGTSLNFHSNLEFPLGGMVGFFGFRTEWTYDWMNIVPPIKGDVQSINMLLTAGVRF